MFSCGHFAPDRPEVNPWAVDGRLNLTSRADCRPAGETALKLNIRPSNESNLLSHACPSRCFSLV